MTWTDAYNALCVLVLAIVLGWVFGMGIVIVHAHRPPRRRRADKQEEI